MPGLDNLSGANNATSAVVPDRETVGYEVAVAPNFGAESNRFNANTPVPSVNDNTPAGATAISSGRGWVGMGIVTPKPVGAAFGAKANPQTKGPSYQISVTGGPPAVFEPPGVADATTEPATNASILKALIGGG